jgi:hypothetical protein|tara:strand:+ start:33 stop:296 length:264 start_codon:yes stop_codon:yes gene_type:complete
MSNEIQEWLVIKTNKDKTVFTQVVLASELNEALNLSEEIFNWERQADIFSSCNDNYYELLNEYGVSNIDLLPDDIQAFPKVLEEDDE